MFWMCHGFIVDVGVIRGGKMGCNMTWFFFFLYMLINLIQLISMLTYSNLINNRFIFVETTSIWLHNYDANINLSIYYIFLNLLLSTNYCVIIIYQTSYIIRINHLLSGMYSYLNFLTRLLNVSHMCLLKFDITRHEYDIILWIVTSRSNYVSIEMSQKNINAMLT